MSHEMIGLNHNGEEIAYVRFTMNDFYANIIYDLFDAQEHNGGVSGKGYAEIYSFREVKNACKTFDHLIEQLCSKFDEDVIPWQLKEIKKFLTQCLLTAEKEENVSICYF